MEVRSTFCVQRSCWAAWFSQLAAPIDQLEVGGQGPVGGFVRQDDVLGSLQCGLAPAAGSLCAERRGAYPLPLCICRLICTLTLTPPEMSEPGLNIEPF